VDVITATALRRMVGGDQEVRVSRSLLDQDYDVQLRLSRRPA
jgi:hypothetical protein